MSRRTYVDYFHDIYEAAGFALSFVAGVDPEVIWRTVHEDLPPLHAALCEILDGLA